MFDHFQFYGIHSNLLTNTMVQMTVVRSAIMQQMFAVTRAYRESVDLISPLYEDGLIATPTFYKRGHWGSKALSYRFNPCGSWVWEYTCAG